MSFRNIDCYKTEVLSVLKGYCRYMIFCPTHYQFVQNLVTTIVTLDSKNELTHLLFDAYENLISTTHSTTLIPKIGLLLAAELNVDYNQMMQYIHSNPPTKASRSISSNDPVLVAYTQQFGSKPSAPLYYGPKYVVSDLGIRQLK